MSLVGFHRFLIVTAIAFCLGFAAWQLRAYLRFDADSGALVLAGVFLVLGLGLTAYLARLRSFLHLEE
ncbi:MAG: hypothetical protein GWM90_20890 [Gemmatimonadetes bacterium]|nr:hypothetical protein [Gemmatimonadota bacterium]NIQ56956.1 hypothetical protein [Gemmatimonadota bacterium]NIU77127.1 hypothetical protein [Gammaproteobacteria bacterium]NIX46448.1 hypothetical protein [Gemmatimonadota bacterium]NIY10763.1 hypothetical protein [Gemmatimonadota bacterium]